MIATLRSVRFHRFRSLEINDRWNNYLIVGISRTAPPGNGWFLDSGRHGSVGFTFLRRKDHQ